MYISNSKNIDITNSENLLAFEITNNDLKFSSDRYPNLAFELRTYVPPAEGGV